MQLSARAETEWTAQIDANLAALHRAVTASATSCSWPCPRQEPGPKQDLTAALDWAAAGHPHKESNMSTIADERIPHDLRLAAYLAALALIDAEIGHARVLAEKMPDAGDPDEDKFFKRIAAVYRPRSNFRDAWRAIYNWQRKNPELPTQGEIDSGPHAHLGNIPSDYAKA